MKWFRKRKPKPVDRQGSLRLMEEAVHLLRGGGVKAWAWYAVGVVPFWLELIRYVGAMSSSGLAASMIVPGALPVALLYVWMKICQSMFAVELWRSNGQGGTMDFRGFRRLAFRQAAWQPYGLVLVTLSHLLAVPYPFTAAFFQNLTVCEALGETEGGESVRAAATRFSSHDVIKSLTFLYLGKPSLCFLIFLNWLTFLAFFPRLLYSLTGIENVFVRSLEAYTAAGFWMTIAMFTYLTVDPLLKAFYLLRCSYAASRRDGTDLRQELSVFRAPRSAVAALLLVCTAFLAPVTPLPAKSPSGHEQLDETILEVSSREKFTWRMPPEVMEQAAVRQGEASWLRRTIRSWSQGFLDGLEAMFDWWERLFDDLEPREPRNGENLLRGMEVAAKGLMILLIILLVGLAGVLIFKAWRRGRQTLEAVSDAPAVKRPDLNDEEVLANELPADEWLAMVADLQQRGEWRLALRALFLAFLARLEDRRLVVIRRSKSNREYEEELRRRGLPNPELVPFFVGFRRQLEKVWYGDYPATPDQVNDVKTWLEDWGKST